MPGPKPQPLAERFARHVLRGKPDECWLWIGARNPRGYGKIKIKGHYRGAYCVAWELANGCSVPRGLNICHSCDNPSCVNPAHLWTGTQSDNLQDMTTKGRRVVLKTTTCRRGHPFTEANTYHDKTNGWRACRACRLQAKQNYRARQKLITYVSLIY